MGAGISHILLLLTKQSFCLTIVQFLLKTYIYIVFGVDTNVHAYAFASTASVSKNCPFRDCITSVVYGTDIIPRLSVPNLRKHGLAFSTRIRMNHSVYTCMLGGWLMKRVLGKAVIFFNVHLYTCSLNQSIYRHTWMSVWLCLEAK